MQVEVKLEGLNGVLETLKSLPPEIVSKGGGPVKLALKKGATVIWEQAKKNLEVSVANTSDDGKRYSTGLLLKNLVVTRGKPPFSSKGERYLVRVRRKTYERGGKKKVTTLASANLLEYGSAKQPAEPWLRPAFNATAEQAIRTIEADLIKRVNAVVKKLARQNAGRK
jgi:HK97 gp10 family phage protein